MNWVGEAGEDPCSAAGLAGERKEGPGRGCPGSRELVGARGLVLWRGEAGKQTVSPKAPHSSQGSATGFRGV